MSLALSCVTAKYLLIETKDGGGNTDPADSMNKAGIDTIPVTACFAD
jgi:hypothetical protein